MFNCANAHEALSTGSRAQAVVAVLVTSSNISDNTNVKDVSPSID